jgi:hypothetical protein
MEKPPNEGTESFKCERRQKVADMLDKPKSEDVAPAVAPMTDDDESSSHPRPVERPFDPASLLPHQRLRLESPLLSPKGELCFRQRLMALDAPWKCTDSILRALVDPEVQHFWGPFERFVSFINVEALRKCVKDRINVGDEVLDQFLAKVFPQSGGGRIDFEDFARSVQLFGYWWKTSVLNEVIPSYVGTEKNLSLGDAAAGRRLYAFRNSGSNAHCLVVQMKPDCTTQEGKSFNSLRIAFDTTTMMFYIEDIGHHQDTPLKCFKEYLRLQCQDDKLDLEPFHAGPTPPATTAYNNEFRRRNDPNNPL